MNECCITVQSAQLRGIEVVPVAVEISCGQGLPGIHIVGMPDSAVLEARSRVRCALKAAGFTIPRLKITINLSPSNLKKNGTGFDLPIAVALLVVSGQISPAWIQNTLFIGELALDGRVQAVRGQFAYVLAANEACYRFVGSPENLPSNYLTKGALYNLAQLKSSFDNLTHESWHEYAGLTNNLNRILGSPNDADSTIQALVVDSHIEHSHHLDFSDVYSHEFLKKVCIIAATGGHGMLMIGPPGVGKSMLARRIPTILPQLNDQEKYEVMLIHSAAGQDLKKLSGGTPPFRAPHHSISTAGLVGGGRSISPGEISLAHKGVLFLDEFPEFARNALQALRQPLEEKEIRLVRADGLYRFPADFQLIGAANPCPCGYLGDNHHHCSCSESTLRKYRSKFSGPLLDRIDLVCEVSRPETDTIIDGLKSSTSQEMRAQVMQGRRFADLRRTRYKNSVDPKIRKPSSSTLIRAYCFDTQASAYFRHHVKLQALSARSIMKVAQVARTIADIHQRMDVREEDVVMSLSLRPRFYEASE